MKRLLCLLALAMPLACAAAPMTNEDVIKLVKGGLGEATVLQAIDGAEPGCDTSPDGLVKLKQGGVSDAVIQRILAKRGGAPVAAPAPAAAALREPWSARQAARSPATSSRTGHPRAGPTRSACVSTMEAAAFSCRNRIPPGSRVRA